jgi:hypothetical protein
MPSWNGWKDTMQRLFVPGGGGSDPNKSPWWDPGGKMQQDPGADAEKRRKELLYDQSSQAGSFADRSEEGFNRMGAESQASRDYLRRVASGQDSVSAEQLRQGLQQNLAGQRSMAAGASPQNSAMAARTAAMQSARLGSGLAGQQAVAGLQERQGAQKALADMIMQQRQQDLQASLGSRGNAIQGYGAGNAGTPEKSNVEKYGGAIMGGLGAIMSDRRLKEDIKGGDKAANAALEGLRSYTYKYKDEKHGKGERLGIMAQDLEKAGLKHAVIETPEGKAVHGGHLAASNTAMVAALARRVKRLEGSE